MKTRPNVLKIEKILMPTEEVSNQADLLCQTQCFRSLFLQLLLHNSWQKQQALFDERIVT